MRVAHSAVDGIGDHNGFIDIIFAAVDAQDERRNLDMVLANGSAAKTAGGVRRTVTMNAIHGLLLRGL
jgi:hypothetical protein